MEFSTILNTVCGLALGYLGYLIYSEAMQEAIEKEANLNTAIITVIDGEVFVEPIK